MKREDIIARLRQHEADLKRLGVEHLYLFGSIARGEATEESDIDLFFDYEKGKFGLFELMDVKAFTTNSLGTRWRGSAMYYATVTKMSRRRSCGSWCRLIYQYCNRFARPNLRGRS